MCAGAPVGPAPEHGEADPTIADPSLSAVRGPGIDTVRVARGPATERHPMGAGPGMDRQTDPRRSTRAFRRCGGRSHVRPVALLVLETRSAWTRVVAPHLGPIDGGWLAV